MVKPSSALLGLSEGLVASGNGVIGKEPSGGKTCSALLGLFPRPSGRTGGKWGFISIPADQCKTWIRISYQQSSEEFLNYMSAETDTASLETLRIGRSRR